MSDLYGFDKLVINLTEDMLYIYIYIFSLDATKILFVFQHVQYHVIRLVSLWV